MAKILFAWELGANLGHLNRMLQVARALRQNRHEVYFAVKDLSKVQQLTLADDAFVWFQAPVWLPALREREPANSYAEILFFTGFLDPAGLLGLVRGWHAIFAAVRPDLLICDHAPVSLLSARASAMKTVTLGNGFFHPPSISPFPPFSAAADTAQQKAAEADKTALDTANRVLGAMGLTPLRHLHQLFDVDDCILSCWPETDHYLSRDQACTYIGPLGEMDKGVEPQWPVGAHQKKVFAYLNDDYPALDEVLGQLSGGAYATCAYVSGLTPEQHARHSSANLYFSPRPVRMKQALQDADALICHGGGAASLAMLSARPVLVLPKHLEQRIAGERIEAQGCGLTLQEAAVKGDFASALKRVMHDSALQSAAAAFANHHAGYSSSTAASVVVARCEALLAY